MPSLPSLSPISYAYERHTSKQMQIQKFLVCNVSNKQVASICHVVVVLRVSSVGKFWNCFMQIVAFFAFLATSAYESNVFSLVSTANSLKKWLSPPEVTQYGL